MKISIKPSCAQPAPSRGAGSAADRATRCRAAVLGIAFFALFFVLLARLYAIQINGSENHRARREAQTKAMLAVERPRGTVCDVRGQVLALSAPVESAWADPSAFGEDERGDAARELAEILGLRAEDVLEKISRPGRRFVWLKRRLSTGELEAYRILSDRPPFKVSRNASSPKIGLIPEYARRYPNGPLMSHVLGFFSGDPSMHEGVERVADDWLSGERTVFPVSVDGRRRVLDAPLMKLAGADVHLTLDLLLQRVVEEELDAVCAEFTPKWAAAVVMDPRTGAVLAISSRPTFDPNTAGLAPAEARRNRAITDPYEPGSTFKPFLMAYALGLGLVTPKTKFDCENGLWKHGPRLLHDHHPYGMLTLAEVIIKSSNIGAAKLGALVMGKERLHECMSRFGFGVRSGIDLPAEDAGRLFPLSRWSIYTVTSVPMGHEISTTPLQLVAAMSAIANGGMLLRPRVIGRVVEADGTVLVENGREVVRRVLSREAAGKAAEILARVVKEGTGKKAAVEGVAVAGKTGTTQKVDPETGRYSHERFIASFVGFAPAEAARLCVAVVVDEPHGSYYGGSVAAPAVGRIIRRGLVYVR
jgi:cell division protein FtsI (penicillin-binding protein 3)